MLYRTPREVLERITDLRDAASSLRAEIACRICIGLAYHNYRHWNRVTDTRAGTYNTDEEEFLQFPLEEDWDPRSREIRVVDNRIAPLLRETAARTNATRIEAVVRPPKHLRSTEAQNRARVVQNVLNGLDDSAGFTRAARRASGFRWAAGNALIIPTLSRRGQRVEPDVATGADGEPLEYNDQWVRWLVYPLCDLIWDVSNKSADLADHTVLCSELIVTQRFFEQTYGPVERYGLKGDDLPTMGQMAPHYIAASQIGGSSLFESYAKNSKQKALRVYMLLETDPRDPTRWPEMYLVVDATPHLSGFGRIQGNVTNIENPMNAFGHHGRNVFKLDAFATHESIWSWGVPHVLMAHNDMLNIARSLQIQELSTRIYGYWLVDRRGGVNKQDFLANLNQTIGGVIEYNSADGMAQPPTWVHPQAGAGDQYITMMSEIAMSMNSQAHISQMMRGVAKSHVPEEIAAKIMRESAVVVDNIVQADKSVYSDALTLTAGTIRRACEQPNRMLARLRDTIGFNESDLMTLLEVDPEYLRLEVTVAEQSIISRSVMERVTQLREDLGFGAITPDEYKLAMTRELERPATEGQEREVHFVHALIVQIANGMQFQGFPSLNYGLFELVARQYIHGLELTAEDTPRRMARIEQAIEIQRQIALERLAPMSEPGQGAQQGQAAGIETGDFLPPTQGAPESINPVNSPTGATGGLRAGLEPAVA